MAQRIRFDEPGAWLHVMNRGIARRTLFETPADYRYFLACLARAVRAGWFELHAFCLLATHYHLLIRSLRGEAWRGLRRVQNSHSRRFNIRRRRDGPLFKGRFRSKCVRTEEYWFSLVRYIDRNPVAAGLVECPSDWQYGSAHHYVRGNGPLWLKRAAVESVATEGTRGVFTPERYREVFAGPLTVAQTRLVEARIDARSEGNDPLDELIAATPEQVLAWMHRKAKLADGTSAAVGFVLPSTLEAALRALRPVPEGIVAVAEAASDDSAWELLRAGLLRYACGATFRELGQRLGCSQATAHGRVQAFRQVVTAAHPLVRLASQALATSIRTDWPSGSGRGFARDVLQFSVGDAVSGARGGGANDTV